MKFSRSRPSDDPEINVVSMIDVVLLLLVFFMLSTTFVQDGRMKVQLPHASALPERHDADPVVISIGADGAYRVNERALVNNTAATLRAALEKVAPGATGRSENQRQPITIRADARATHQAVVTAMDVAGRLGFSQVNIATVNEQPGG
jgi:biopolymer transport protein ExbD